jgi:Zn-dependent peptidase ImmA (M78 family)
MVVLARESRGMTQNDLGKLLGITQGKMSKIESGLLQISEDEIESFSNLLHYPTSFFYQTEPILGPGISELYHRKRQCISLHLLKKIHALMNIRYIHLIKLLRSIDIGEVNIPNMDIDEHESAENVARLTRAFWHIPAGPISNIINVIENAGGIIIPCDFETNKIDAISRWVPGMPPLFFINFSIPTDRLRFTLSHELGHIIMHHIPNEDMEKEADRFAAEFLMPAYDIKTYFANNLTLERLADLKLYWKVSMASLLYRSKSLEKITDNQYRYLWMQISQLGFKKREPSNLDPPEEKPVLINDLIKFYFNELNYTLSELCSFLDLTENEFKTLYMSSERQLRVIG